MAKYLFSHYSVEGEPRPAMSDEDMQGFVQRIVELEAEMKAEGALVFGGALHGSAASPVVRTSEGDVLTTDGPYVESKEHLGGFYIVEADDLESALEWATKTSRRGWASDRGAPFARAEPL